ncbi:MAG: transporter [Candidatus Omnitrophota bacterium]
MSSSKNILKIAGLFFFTGASLVFAGEPPAPEPAKLVVTDATPVEPGGVELNFVYTLLGSKKQWATDGGRHSRKLLREHAFDSVVNIGLFRGFDVGIAQGFSLLTDKENNYDETGGEVDPATGEPLDATDGPHRGHGRSDLAVNGRWVFYQAQEESLRFAYIPSVVIPTGRRSNYDHLGPSQGYPSMGNLLAVTKDFRRWTATANAAYEVPLQNRRHTEDAAGTLSFGLGAGYQLFSWFQPEAEILYGQDFEVEGKGAKGVSVAVGAILPVHEHFRFDLGLVQDIAGSGREQATSGVFKLIVLV